MTLPIYRQFTNDKLIRTIEIKLTPEQHDYLQENITDLRTLLLKKFNLKFGTTYSKLQLTRALEVMNMPVVNSYDPDKPKNVYYRPRSKNWVAIITVKKKRIFLYSGGKEKAIEAVAEFRKGKIY